MSEKLENKNKRRRGLPGPPLPCAAQQQQAGPARRRPSPPGPPPLSPSSSARRTGVCPTLAGTRARHLPPGGPPPGADARPRGPGPPPRGLAVPPRIPYITLDAAVPRPLPPRHSHLRDHQQAQPPRPLTWFHRPRPPRPARRRLGGPLGVPLQPGHRAPALDAAAGDENDGGGADPRRIRARRMTGSWKCGWRTDGR